MTWLAVRAFLRAVPGWVWVAGLAVAAILFYGHLRFNAGQAETQAKWDAAVAAQVAEDARRQKEADEAALSAAQDAAEAVTDTREETNEAAERVRVEWRDRIVQVPADCRDALRQPDGMRDEGREAVARARSALPAAPNR
jgi:cytoskeletal protein RodZ